MEVIDKEFIGLLMLFYHTIENQDFLAGDIKSSDFFSLGLHFFKPSIGLRGHRRRRDCISSL